MMDDGPTDAKSTDRWPKHGKHWVDARLIRVYPAIFLLIYGGFFIYRFAFADGLMDPWGEPVGSDYSIFRAASFLILEGRPSAPYDMETLVETMRTMLPQFRDSALWNYPPFFHFAIFWLALLPYIPAYVLWCAVTFVPLALVMRRIAPRPQTLWVVAAFPGTFMNLAHGHNGFLSAALLGGGLTLVARRPILAGVLFGLLTFKPHLGILVPLGLICARQWKVFFSAAATTGVISAVSLAVFGIEPWTAFLDNLTSAGALLSGGQFRIEKMPSLYATLILLDVDKTLSIAAHGVLAVLVIPMVAWVWWKRGATPAAAALLVTGTLFLSPYLYEYDLMVMAVPIGLLAWEGCRYGWLPWEREILVLAWLTPLLVTVSGAVFGLQIGTVCLLALYAVALRRALKPGGGPESAKNPGNPHLSGVRD